MIARYNKGTDMRASKIRIALVLLGFWVIVTGNALATDSQADPAGLPVRRQVTVADGTYEHVYAEARQEDEESLGPLTWSTVCCCPDPQRDELDDLERQQTNNCCPEDRATRCAIVAGFTVVGATVLTLSGLTYWLLTSAYPLG